MQQLLAAIWYEGLPGFRRKNIVGQALQLAKLAFMFPLYCTVYMMAPNSKMGLFMTKPFVKFIVHSASYGFFLSKTPSKSDPKQKCVCSAFRSCFATSRDFSVGVVRQRVGAGNGQRMEKTRTRCFVRIGRVWSHCLCHQYVTPSNFLTNYV